MLLAKKNEMIIYIRHGEEEHQKDATYVQDVKLVKRGHDACRKKCIALVEKYGYPQHLYCSPLRRTVATAALFSETLKREYGLSVPVLVRPCLQRFFVRSEREDVSVAPQTFGAGVKIESSDKSKKKVRHGHDELEKLHPDEIVWCVTHAVVIKEVRRMTEGKLKASDEHQPFLYSMAAKSKKRKISK